MPLSRCAKCGETLIARDDGQPRWCMECSMEDNRKEQEEETRLRDKWYAEKERKKKELVKKPPLVDPIIFKMEAEAKTLIENGDMRGHLAYYWIRTWLENPPISLNEDEFGKGNRVEEYVSAHPKNFTWKYGSTNLDENSSARHAIEYVYALAGGKP